MNLHLNDIKGIKQMLGNKEKTYKTFKSAAHQSLEKIRDEMEENVLKYGMTN